MTRDKRQICVKKVGGDLLSCRELVVAVSDSDNDDDDDDADNREAGRTAGSTGVGEGDRCAECYLAGRVRQVYGGRAGCWRATMWP